jgi:hypothetical protein
MEDTTMRNRYPDRETLPADLKKDFEVVIREEYRDNRGVREKQYVAQQGGYKLVVDDWASQLTSILLEDGARVIMEPLHTPNGHIVFCRVRYVLADKDGTHPLIGRVRSEIERGYSIAVVAWRPTRTLLAGRLRRLSVETKKEVSTYKDFKSTSIQNFLTIETDNGSMVVEVGGRWIYGSGGKTTCAGIRGRDSVQLSLHKSY